MSPITFSLTKSIPKPAIEIMTEIADLSRWPEFEGYGPMPGIKSAEYEIRTPELKGSRIRVTNTDGSSHSEDFLEWDPGQRVLIKLHGFGRPVKYFASHFIEEWTFSEEGGATEATRRFELHPVSPITRPGLAMIARFLRSAIASHLDQIAGVR